MSGISISMTLMLMCMFLALVSLYSEHQKLLPLPGRQNKPLLVSLLAATSKTKLSLLSIVRVRDPDT